MYTFRRDICLTRYQDYPLREWTRESRDEFLQELLLAEGRGDHQQYNICPACSLEKAEYRCKTCVAGGELVCKACVIKNHQQNPLHAVEVSFILFLMDSVADRCVCTKRWTSVFFRKDHPQGHWAAHPTRTLASTRSSLCGSNPRPGRRLRDHRRSWCAPSRPRLLWLWWWIPHQTTAPRSALSGDRTSAAQRGNIRRTAALSPTFLRVQVLRVRVLSQPCSRDEQRQSVTSQGL